MRDFGKIITDPSNAVLNEFMDNSCGDYVFRVGEEIYATVSTGSLKPKKYVGFLNEFFFLILYS
jgi:hypothetical protein